MKLRYEVIGSCQGTVENAEITTNVVETSTDWMTTAKWLERQVWVDWVLWMAFPPTFNSLDEAMDFVKGRAPFQYPLSQDRVEVVR